MSTEIIGRAVSLEVIGRAHDTDVIERDHDTEVIDSPEGPIGPPGPASAAADYIHPQAAASAEWIVNHNLGVEPQIAVLTPGGVEVIADVVHISPNQARIYFAQPVTGQARCI